MTKKQKKMLYRILIAAVLFLAAKFIPMPMLVSTALYFAAYVTIGYDILRKAWKGICNHQVFDENFLMAVATIGAIALAIYEKSGDYAEAVAVMLFYQIGELFQSYAVGKSRRNITALMDIRPDYANIERDGKLEQVDPDDVAVGTVITVQPGEKIPIDGEIVEGASTLNTAALTGESLPRDVMTGDEVISGCINMTGVLKVRTTKAFGESTVSKILELMENSSSHKSRSEAFISRFARIYTPAVCIGAVLLGVAVPLLRMAFGASAQWVDWVYRALTFLVVSCPCALVISIPLSFFAGIGGASKEGILIKGSNYLEALAATKVVVFDKTGTLTHGEFAVAAVHADDSCPDHSFHDADNVHIGEYSDKEKILLHLAAHAEHFTTHPIGAALRTAFPQEATDGCEVTDVEEIAGQGIRAKVNGKEVCVGNKKMMESISAQWHDCNQVGTIIHVAIDGKYAGHIVINDTLKEGSAHAIRELKELGVEKTVMLTGDRREVGEDVAHKLGLDECRAELLPTDKVSHVEQLLKTKTAGKTLAYVGDGINDAPVLKRADVGIAMGGLGSDAAIEAADVVLMDDDPRKIALAVKIARRTIHIAHENVIFAIGVKVAVLILATIGLGTMWMAVFADVGVTVLAVLNAMRSLGKNRLFYR